jgi:hypothetical protein
MGACLQQQLPASLAWQPLGFFSRKLEPAQKKYSPFDKELYACWMGIRHFRFMVEGGKLTIFTDHKPFTSALGWVMDP